MRRFADLFRSRLGHAVVLAVGIFCTQYLRNAQIMLTFPGKLQAAVALEIFANWFFMSLTIVAIVSACELSLRPGWARAFAQAAVLASGSVVYAYAVGTSYLLTIQYRALGQEEGLELFMYITWMGWATSAFLSAFYGAHERANTAASAMRRAELERERTQQRLLESRLQVLEAQVEPRFLSDALSRVQRLYAEDPGRADQALDDLIAYLRAALPQGRGEASTLGRELDLVETYLRIVSTEAHRIHRARAPLEAAYAPPMVLLPIVQRALKCGQNGIEMDIVEGDESTGVRVGFAGGGNWDGDSQLQSLRATLALLFGSEGRLEVAATQARTTFSVSWPSAAPASSLHHQPA